MKTEQEVVQFLEQQVGKRVNSKAGVLNGQCVTLIKALLEFLGAPNPYAARGHAKDYATNLVKQGIASNGAGVITVVVNPDMGVVGGVTYGHIWVQVKGGANYEQNGVKALTTTKNTRPLSQGRQFVNLDKWLKKGDEMITLAGMQISYLYMLGRLPDAGAIKNYVGKITFDENVGRITKSKEYKERVAAVKRANVLGAFPGI